MKNRVKFALVVSFAAAAAFVFWHSTQNAKAASPTDQGRNLYLKNCAVCHGSNGRANTPKGRKLQAADLTSSDVQAKSAASITRTVKNGRLDMPAFGKKLRPSQIASLVKYIRGF